MFFDLSNQCVLCGRQADTGLCPHCHQELERHCALSGPLCRCALPGPGLDPGALCGRCLDRPPGFAASYCACSPITPAPLFRCPLASAP